jgi:streptogramin lyase
MFKIPGGNGTALTTHQMIRDREGNIWMNISAGDEEFGEAGLTSVGKVDPKTDKLEIYTVPKGFPGVGGFGDVDNKGNAWFAAGHGVVRLDAATHQFKKYEFKGGAGSPYGVTADINGNGWGSQFSNELEGRADVETGDTMDVQIPPPPRAARVKALFSPEDIALYEKIGSRGFTEGIPWYNAPRRPQGDKSPGADSVWVPGWFGGTIMKINIYNYKVTQYLIPQPELDGAYDLKVDKDHMVWADFQNSETIGKFDPKTEKWVEYRLPTLGMETHAIGYLDDKDGRTKITATSLRLSKIAYMEFRTRQEHEALRAEAARKVTASK